MAGPTQGRIFDAGSKEMSSDHLGAYFTANGAVTEFERPPVKRSGLPTKVVPHVADRISRTTDVFVEKLGRDYRHGRFPLGRESYPNHGIHGLPFLSNARRPLHLMLYWVNGGDISDNALGQYGRLKCCSDKRFPSDFWS